MLLLDHLELPGLGPSNNNNTSSVASPQKLSIPEQGRGLIWRSGILWRIKETGNGNAG
jgi:hypothetical protein